jgi:hypothetical protein
MMDTETIAAAVLLLALLAIAFWAGYGWRIYIEVYRHNRPWLEKHDERKRRAAAQRRERLKAFLSRLLRGLRQRSTVRDEQD